MKFINNTGKNVKVRVDEEKGCRWQTVHVAEVVDLLPHYGDNLGFAKCEEPKEVNITIAKMPPEPKESVPSVTLEELNEEVTFEKKLNEVKGIGKKTAEDVANVFKNAEALKKAIEDKKDLPFRDDVNKLLKKKFK